MSKRKSIIYLQSLLRLKKKMEKNDPQITNRKVNLKAGKVACDCLQCWNIPLIEFFPLDQNGTFDFDLVGLKGSGCLCVAAAAKHSVAL